MGFAAVLLWSVESAAEPIYVYREAHGVVRFTNRAPPPGVRAEAFTAGGRRFSVLGRGWSWSRARLHPNKYSEIIEGAARECQVDPALVKAIIHVESAFDPQAVSPKGALGLMQLMPGTARRHGVRNPFEPQQNIYGGTRHIAMLLRKYQGNLKFALAAYNAGEEAVEQYNGIPPYAETRDYVARVVSFHSRYVANVKG